MDEPEAYRLTYLELATAISRYERQKQEYEEKLKFTSQRLKLLTRLQHFFSEPVCSYCKGTGEVIHFYAQDESKYEKCTVCGGTGAKK